MEGGQAMVRSRFLLLMVLALVCSALAAGPAQAQVAKQGNDVLSSLSFTHERLVVSEPVEAFDDAQSELSPGLRNGWAAFRLGANGEWRAVVDRRTGQVSLAEGAGIPLIPGRGNGLTNQDIAGALGGRARVDLPTLDAAARGFMPRVAALLGVNPST